VAWLEVVFDVALFHRHEAGAAAARAAAEVDGDTIFFSESMQIRGGWIPCDLFAATRKLDLEGGRFGGGLRGGILCACFDSGRAERLELHVLFRDSPFVES